MAFVALIVFRLARIARPTVVPIGAFCGGRVTVGRVLLGRTVLGWTVLCAGREVASGRGEGRPEAMAEAAGVVALVHSPTHGGLRRRAVLVRSDDCATAEAPGVVAVGVTHGSLSLWNPEAAGGTVDLRSLGWHLRSAR